LGRNPLATGQRAPRDLEDRPRVTLPQPRAASDCNFPTSERLSRDVTSRRWGGRAAQASQLELSRPVHVAEGALRAGERDETSRVGGRAQPLLGLGAPGETSSGCGVTQSCSCQMLEGWLLCLRALISTDAQKAASRKGNHLHCYKSGGTNRRGLCSP